MSGIRRGTDVFCDKAMVWVEDDTKRKVNERYDTPVVLSDKVCGKRRNAQYAKKSE